MEEKQKQPKQEVKSAEQAQIDELRQENANLNARLTANEERLRLLLEQFVKLENFAIAINNKIKK